MLLELATFQPDTIAIANACGVRRLELCEHYNCGGLTPSDSFFDTARTKFQGDLFVMIRPRPGDYIFSEGELKGMLQDIRKFRLKGANGFVSGCFSGAQTIQVYHLKKILEACDGLPFTFHRSFDEVKDWKRGLEILTEAGCARLLTSGDGKTAVEGRTRLREMMEFCGEKLIILPGGGVRSFNVQEIIDTCHPAEIHTAALDPRGGEVADALELEKLMQITSV